MFLPDGGQANTHFSIYDVGLTHATTDVIGAMHDAAGTLFLHESWYLRRVAK
jgi:hypothetical protein